MKKIVQILTIAASWMAALLFSDSAFSQSTYREESGVLEQIYESRARSALNNVFRPNEYSVVISVDINQDQKQLDALEAQMDNMNLPGVAGLVLPENMGMSNKLHGLRNKVAVQLLIDEAVSKEKEEAAKSLIQMRLHMDEGAGDVITVSRASLVPKEKLPEPDLLPELSWRMWALVIIVSLLALGLLIYAIQKRKEVTLNKKMQSEPPAVDPIKEQPAPPAPVQEVAPPPVAEAVEKPFIQDRELIELYERKKSLVRIAQKFPEAASKSMEEQYEKGFQGQVVTVMDHLGWEEAKGLFKGLSHRTWSRVGSMMVSQQKKPNTSEILAAFEHCHKNVVAKYLELADGDLNNPFSFIAKIDNSDLKRLVEKESPQDLAVICAYLESAEKAILLEALSEDLQQATLIHLTKIREINYDRVKSLSEQLKMRLKIAQENPSKNLDGVSFLVDLLRQLDVQAEFNFLQKLAIDSPKEYENLRRVYLIFNDIVLVPTEIVAEALSSMDMRLLTAALFHASSDLRYFCLKTLPEKRAKMIEKDLSYIKNQSKRESLSAQRAVQQAVSASLLMEGISLAGLIKQDVTKLSAIEAA